MGNKNKLLSFSTVTIALALCQLTWLITLIVTGLKGSTKDVPLTTIQNGGKYLGVFLAGGDNEPFLSAITGALLTFFQFVASCQLICGWFLEQDIIKKFWLFEQANFITIASLHRLRSLSAKSDDDNPEGIWALLSGHLVPFYLFNGFFMYRTWASMQVPQRNIAGRSVGVNHHDRKLSEFLQAFTALSIVGFVAASVAGLLAVGYVADNLHMASEWWTRWRLLACLQFGIGVWGSLFTEYIALRYNFTARPWHRLVFAIPLSIGGNQLLKFACHDIYFDSFLALYFMGVFLPTSVAVIIYEAVQIKYGRRRCG